LLNGGFRFSVPSQPPPNVSVQTVSSQSILVTWHHIPQQFVHGVLLGYRVYYQAWSSSPFNTTFIESTKTSIFLKRLEFFTQYRIEVAGVTRSGEVPRSRGTFARTGE
jgi:hypothetical protein